MPVLSTINDVQSSQFLVTQSCNDWLEALNDMSSNAIADSTFSLSITDTLNEFRAIRELPASIGEHFRR